MNPHPDQNGEPTPAGETPLQPFEELSPIRPSERKHTAPTIGPMKRLLGGCALFVWGVFLIVVVFSFGLTGISSSSLWSEGWRKGLLYLAFLGFLFVGLPYVGVCWLRGRTTIFDPDERRSS